MHGTHGTDCTLPVSQLRACFKEDSFIDFVQRNVPGMFLRDPLPPSLRNVKFQNDPLILISIAMSRTNGPRPKQAPRVILTTYEWWSRMNINQYLLQTTCTHFLGVIIIFSQFLFNSWLEKIYNFHFNRNVKQQNPYPLKVPETFLWTKSINESSLKDVTLTMFNLPLIFNTLHR